MIKTILTAAKSTFSQPISQPAPEPPTDTDRAQPRPAVPMGTPPEAILKAAPKTAKELAVETAVQVGYSAGDEVSAVICRHQTARHPNMLFVEVPGWSEPVVCFVKDAKSWQPVNPPYNRLKARWSGMADVEGRLVFESADECKKSRLIRRK